MTNKERGKPNEIPQLEHAQLVPQGAKSSQRRDRMGNRIDKCKKKHHISFKDEVTEKNISEAREVESYKIYNIAFENEVETCQCKLL